MLRSAAGHTSTIIFVRLFFIWYFVLNFNYTVGGGADQLKCQWTRQTLIIYSMWLPFLNLNYILIFLFLFLMLSRRKFIDSFISNIICLTMSHFYWLFFWPYNSPLTNFYQEVLFEFVIILLLKALRESVVMHRLADINLSEADL